MLFAPLLLSPYPHARIRSIDTSAALAMPGVKAILTADEVPGPKDQVNDAGQTIRANPRSEKALTNEPLYQGEAVLAVAAVDELTAAEAIEKIKIRWEPLPFSVDPVASLLPGGANPRVEGNVWIRATPVPGQPPGLPEVRGWRGVTAITNTPPRRAQSQPGGMQGIVLLETVVNKAARPGQPDVYDKLLPQADARQGSADFQVG